MAWRDRSNDPPKPPKPRKPTKPRPQRNTGKPAGHPTLLNEDVQKKICDALSNGAFFKHACRYAGISHQTGEGWMQRGRKALDAGEWAPTEQIYVDFVKACETAKNNLVVAGVLVVRKAMQPTLAEKVTITTTKADGTVVTKEVERHHPPDWRAAQAMLKAQENGSWSDKAKVEVTGKDGGAMKVDISDGLDDAKRAAAVADLLARFGQGAAGPTAGG